MKCFLLLFLLPCCALAQDTLRFGEWTPIFDGKTLTNWEPIDFAGGEAGFVTNGVMVIPGGLELSGMRYTGKTPSNLYEVAFEAQRVGGSDFFGGLTFPVGTNACTLVVGGWGGGVIGVSSIDRLDAAENETTEYHAFKNNTWYKILMRVDRDKLEMWLDEKQIFEVETKERSIAMRPGEIEMAAPFSLSSFMSTAHVRNIRIRTFTKPTRE